MKKLLLSISLASLIGSAQAEILFQNAFNLTGQTIGTDPVTVVSGYAPTAGSNNSSNLASLQIGTGTTLDIAS